MNNIERLEVVRGPESTIYGSDAMTSVVQMWTATGTTLKPVFEFGADGGTFSTANGYASVAGADKIFDYNFFLNQFDTQGQGINDAYSNALQGGNVGIRLSQRVALSLSPAPLQQLDRRAVELVVQRRSGAAAQLQPGRPPEQLSRQRRALPSAAPAHGSTPSPATSTTTCRPIRSRTSIPAASSLTAPSPTSASTTAPDFRYQGHWTPRRWAQTTIGYTFEDENGNIHPNSLPAPTSLPTASPTDCASTTICSRRNSSIWKRVSALAGLGYVNNTSFGNKVVPRVSGSFLLLHGNETFSGTRLRAGYAEGIKEPSFQQSFGIAGTFPTLPNPNLKPEQNHSVEAGFEQGFCSATSYALTAILLTQLSSTTRSNIRPTPSTSPASTSTSTSRSSHGAEVELRGQISNHLLVHRRLHLHLNPDHGSAAVRPALSAIR